MCKKYAKRKKNSRIFMKKWAKDFLLDAFCCANELWVKAMKRNEQQSGTLKEKKKSG